MCKKCLEKIAKDKEGMRSLRVHLYIIKAQISTDTFDDVELAYDVMDAQLDTAESVVKLGMKLKELFDDE